MNDGKGVVWKGEIEGHQIEEDKGDFDIDGFIEYIRHGDDPKKVEKLRWLSLRTKESLA